MTLPTRMRDVRNFMDSIDVRKIESDVAAEASSQIVIIGPVNSGKSTLFNQLKGQRLSKVSAVPGTTTEAISERFGPFWLVDTPGFDEVSGDARALTASSALNTGSVVILVLDGSSGMRQSDADLLKAVQQQGLPVVVVLNKIDLLKKDAGAAVMNAERKLRVPVIGISAKEGTNIAEQLIPALINSHPAMAVTIGRSLPRYRRRAAQKVIRESSALALAVGAEPVPGLAIPFLIGVQVRMLLRLAAIYGEGWTAARARDLIGAVIGGVAIRYGARELAKLLPGIGWVVAGVASATGTAALGNVAIVLFEAEDKLSNEEIRELYKKFRRNRKQTQADYLGDDPTL